MAILDAEVRTQVEERSLERTTREIDRHTNKAEQLSIRPTGLDKLKERVSDTLEGASGTADMFAGAGIGAGLGSMLPGSLGIPGAGAGAMVGGGAGATGMGSAATDALKATPVTATLGAIAASTTAIARNTGPLGSILDMFDTAISMALLPINQVMSDIVRPFAMEAMDMAQNFNENVSGDGLSVLLPDTIDFFLEGIHNTIGFLRDNIGPQIWNALPGWVQDGLLTARDILDNVWGWAGDIWDIFTDTASGIASLVTYFTSGDMRDDINTAVSNAIPGGNVSGPGVFDSIGELSELLGGGTNQLVDSIPGLASGGVVTSPTMAMVGEGTESEAVLPLSDLERMLNVDHSIDVNVDTDVSLDDTDVVPVLEDIRKLLRDIKNQDPVEISQSRFGTGRK